MAEFPILSFVIFILGYFFFYTNNKGYANPYSIGKVSLSTIYPMNETFRRKNYMNAFLILEDGRI